MLLYSCVTVTQTEIGRVAAMLKYDGVEEKRLFTAVTAV